MNRTSLASLAVGAIAAAALTGCGGSDFADEPVEDIIEAASADMQELESVRITADITTGGEEIALDLALNTDGECAGTVEAGGGTAEIISTGDQSWFKADEALFESVAGSAAPQIIELVGDNWVVDDNQQFSSFCNLDELLADIGDPDVEGAETDGTEDVDGQETVRVVGTNEDDDESTIFISVDEPHYIVRFEVAGGDEGTATFSEFDEDVEAEAPPEDEVVEIPGG